MKILLVLSDKDDGDGYILTIQCADPDFDMDKVPARLSADDPTLTGSAIAAYVAYQAIVDANAVRHPAPEIQRNGENSPPPLPVRPENKDAVYVRGSNTVH